MSEYSKLLDEEYTALTEVKEQFKLRRKQLQDSCPHKDVSDWVIAIVASWSSRSTMFKKVCVRCNKEITYEWRKGVYWVMKDGIWINGDHSVEI
jgi:hypothetical protein